MNILEKWRNVPKVQRFRYITIGVSCLLFLGPLTILPSLVGNSDLCGRLCMRRFYLYFPGMTFEDLMAHMSAAMIGVIAMGLILLTTIFFGRIWCGFLCPVGGFSELVSRLLNDRWKIEYRWLPQFQIRYGYLGTYMIILPALGVSACTLCNFITVPRLVEAMSGGSRGFIYIFSAVGIVNLSLLLLLGFFANKGRAYCQFMCPIGAIDGVVNSLGARFGSTHKIRVAKERCTGCNVCARNCMCGAIKMVDKIATVEQSSCMSCHECVDVCDWNAIEWTTASRNKQPKRVKKGIQIFPEPDWQSIEIVPRKEVTFKDKQVHWARVANGLIFGVFSLAIAITSLIH
jgi:ferredoxin-type protein NapH